MNSTTLHLNYGNTYITKPLHRLQWDTEDLTQFLCLNNKETHTHTHSQYNLRHTQYTTHFTSVTEKHNHKQNHNDKTKHTATNANQHQHTQHLTGMEAPRTTRLQHHSITTATTTITTTVSACTGNELRTKRECRRNVSVDDEGMKGVYHH